MTAIIRPAALIRKYYQDSPVALRVLLDHSRLVTRRAVRIAERLHSSETVDLRFLAEAAMLHDIGSIRTYAPDLGCFGTLPYLCHGIKGRELLEAEGLYRHALVCERHIGVGLTAEEIQKNRLPLPARDMIPVTLEEQIICYADLFYSKNPQERGRENDPATVRSILRRFGPGKTVVFDRWLERFEPQLR
jgi:uncharacterized protein